MNKILTLVVIFTYSNLFSDDLLNPYMTKEEYILFNEKVSEAVSSHPEYLSSLDSLKAAGANLRGTKANFLPQIKLLIDSNNQLDRNFEEGANNLFEKSRSEHKTDATITVSQLLYDFGATKNDISRSESLFNSQKAELSSTILDLIYRSCLLYTSPSPRDP